MSSDPVSESASTSAVQPAPVCAAPSAVACAGARRRQRRRGAHEPDGAGADRRDEERVPAGPERALGGQRQQRLDEEGVGEQAEQRAEVRERVEPPGRAGGAQRVPALEQRAVGREQEVGEADRRGEEGQDARHRQRLVRRLPRGAGRRSAGTPARARAAARCSDPLARAARGACRPGARRGSRGRAPPGRRAGRPTRPRRCRRTRGAVPCPPAAGPGRAGTRRGRSRRRAPAWRHSYPPQPAESTSARRRGGPRQIAPPSRRVL